MMGQFEETYRKHFDAVFRYAFRYVGRRDVAEDVTSEAFLALYRNWDKIDRSQLPGWLITVAKNRAIDYLRRSSRDQQCADPPAERQTELHAHLQTFVLESKALKPVHRVCLILRYIHGMSREEIARHTGFTETQVKGYLQYALQLLREAFAPRPTKEGHAPQRV